MKKFINIKEVSKLLGIKEHVIRYWDSENPKTGKIRVNGISTKTKEEPDILVEIILQN